MYLHWRFLNGYWGKYLKCRKYVHSGQAQTYQDSSKPPWGLGWVLLHLSTSTSLCRSTGLAEGCWRLLSGTHFSPLYLSKGSLRCVFFFLTYFSFSSSIYYVSLMFMLLCIVEVMCSGPVLLWLPFARNAAIPLLVLLWRCVYSHQNLLMCIQLNVILFQEKKKNKNTCIILYCLY